MEILPNIHLIPGIVANTYILIDPGGLTLVDAGLPGSAPKILRYLNEMGKQPADVKNILITHSDLDHVGSLAELRQKSEAQVCTSPVEAQAIRDGQPSRPIIRKGIGGLVMRLLGLIYRPIPADVDQTLAEGQVLPILGGLEVLSTPGHTPGHLSFWQSAQRILFSGDSILFRTGQLVPSQGYNNWDEQQSQASFSRQAALKPTAILGGHGWTDQDIENKLLAS